MSQAPIACSLTAAEQAKRVERSGAIAKDSMLEASITDRGASMRFRSEAEADLRDLIAMESKCCAFIDFDLRIEASVVSLDVEGPEGSRPIILELFGLDAGNEELRSGAGRR